MRLNYRDVSPAEQAEFQRLVQPIVTDVRQRREAATATSQLKMMWMSLRSAISGPKSAARWAVRDRVSIGQAMLAERSVREYFKRLEKKYGKKVNDATFFDSLEEGIMWAAGS